MTSTTAAEKNRRLAGMLFGVALGMVGLAYVSVPLYALFCKLTGFGGATQVAKDIPNTVLSRTMQVRFNTDVAPELPWDFSAPEQNVTLKVGEAQLISYKVKNNGKDATQGIAVFNVQPERAGLYFNKVQCFCFEDKPLAPGETAALPVQFFIDPAIAKDPLMDDVKTITLSYTFFASKSPRLADAQKKFDADQQKLMDAAKNSP